jgi:hypothetical protein
MPRFRLWLHRRSHHRCVVRLVPSTFAAAAFAAALAAAPTPATTLVGQAQASEPFPFGSELVLDAAPMRGSRRVPIIQIEDNGTASIDLWCTSVKAQATVNNTAITIVPGDAQSAQCDPDRQARDADLLAQLTQVTGWRWSGGGAIELTGAVALRFHRLMN